MICLFTAGEDLFNSDTTKRCVCCGQKATDSVGDTDDSVHIAEPEDWMLNIYSWTEHLEQTETDLIQSVMTLES